jgi:alpha-L-arabinofuranosidase
MVMANKPLTGQDGLYASAAFDQNSKEIILKLVNSGGEAQPVEVVLEGAKKLALKAKMILMKSEDLNVANSLEQPSLLSPVEQEVILKGKTVIQTLAPYSFCVIRIIQKQ